MRRAIACLFSILLVVLAGCQSISGSYPKDGSIIPDASIQLTPDYSIALADALLIAGVVVLVYQVVDPRAPAWEITEMRYPDNKVVFNLKMQRIHIGGQGEARQVLERRLRAMVRTQGLAGYELRRYEESIDSRIWLPHRTVEAEAVLIAAGT